MAHLGMHDVVFGIGDQFADLETECLLQPLESGTVVPIDDGGYECRAVGGFGVQSLTNP
jgi:hypothetical protein